MDYYASGSAAGEAVNQLVGLRIRLAGNQVRSHLEITTIRKPTLLSTCVNYPASSREDP